MLYSHNGKEPTTLPHRIILSDGRSRTDANTFTEEELTDAGYTPVSDKPYVDPMTQKIAWNSNTVDWDIIQLTEEEKESKINEIWDSIRIERDMLLKSTDHLVFISYENGTAVSEELKNYRQALRDIPQNNSDPFNIDWPTMPTVVSGTN